MFGQNGGDTYLPTQIDDTARVDHFAVSSVRDGKSGDLILKLVNGAAAPKVLHVELPGAKDLAPNANKTVLTGDPMAVNTFDTPKPLVPENSTIAIGESFDYEAPPMSLTVIRIKSGANK